MSAMFSGSFLSKSGILLPFRINCEAFDEADWDILADLVGRRTEFNVVVGIKHGGLSMATRLERYAVPQNKKKKRILLVDDVLTTGRSMTEFYEKLKTPETKIQGVVVFARSRKHLPHWVEPIFQLHGIYADDF